MKKTLQEIVNDMLNMKLSLPALAVLTSTSKVSIWRQILDAVAFVIFNFQEAANLHMAEIDTKISEQKVPTLRWYRNEALRFQYGFDLLDESDQFSTEFDDGTGTMVTATEDQVEASKIVKYAAVSKIEGTSKISMKIAPEDGNTIFDDNQMTAFAKYLSEIQAAGDNISIVNYLPDVLKIAFKVVYDPLVLLSDGTSIITGEKPVQMAILNFLQNLPFDGKLSVQKLEAAILAADGVEDLQNLFVQSKWIEPGVGYGYLQPVDIAKIPESGRFTIIDDVTGQEDWSGIQYITI